MKTDEGSEIPGNNLADWLGVEDSIPFIPSFLDQDIADCDWWALQSSVADPDNYLFNLPPAASPSNPTTAPSQPPQSLPPPKLSKKRQRCPNPTNEPPVNNTPDSQVNRKQPVNTGSRKGGGSSSGSKEVRWAEQLLNPLASAIETHNLSRVQHLLYVLQELASPTADANHRLASHGLRALTRHLSIPFTGGHNTAAPTFATTDPELFRSALIRFNEVSPWFAFHNSLANNSILQILTADSASNNQRTRNLHVVDIGVSHGIQWPTMLEPLTRRTDGPPSLVRLTVAGDVIPPGPFSSPPQGYDFPSRLLRYAKSLNLNLNIHRISDLMPESLSLNCNEILVVCVQFRAHPLDVEQRTALMKSVRDLDPDLVILTEIDGGDGATSLGFGKRAEVVWRFLDSTSAAFKGRDCNERRVVEGEMARILEQGGELGEGRERWKERMEGVGFKEEGFGDEAVDAGRALLRKYDGNWEMRTTTALETALGAGIGLWWKGQQVSFCSVWKTVRGGLKLTEC